MTLFALRRALGWWFVVVKFGWSDVMDVKHSRQWVEDMLLCGTSPVSKPAFACWQHNAPKRC